MNTTYIEPLVQDFYWHRTNGTWQSAATALGEHVVVPILTKRTKPVGVPRDEIAVASRGILEDVFVRFPLEEPWISWSPHKPFVPIVRSLAEKRAKELFDRRLILNYKISEEKWEPKPTESSKPGHSKVLLELCELAVSSFSRAEFLTYCLVEFHLFDYEAVAECLGITTRQVTILRTSGIRKIKRAVSGTAGHSISDEQMTAATFEAVRRRMKERQTNG